MMPARPATPVPEEASAELQSIAIRLQGQVSRLGREVVAIGQDLRRAKELLPHGSFETWVEQTVGITPRWARQFMAAAERFGDKPELTSGLPGGVVLALASPSIPDGLVADVFARRVPATVRAIGQRMDEERTERHTQRVMRDLITALWDLPDEVEAAASVLAYEVLLQDETFVMWGISLLRRAADLIEAAEGRDR